MNREDLLNISYPSDKEKKLKLILRNKIEEYSFNKAFINLTTNNQLLLNSCNIDENNFNFILFKNYFYSLNSKEEFDFCKLTQSDKDTIELFNKFINNNDFNSALQIYENSYMIYEILCYEYIRNLALTEFDKINKLPETELENFSTKINLLSNMDLSFKRNQEKTLLRSKVSNR